MVVRRARARDSTEPPGPDVRRAAPPPEVRIGYARGRCSDVDRSFHDALGAVLPARELSGRRATVAGGTDSHRPALPATFVRPRLNPPDSRPVIRTTGGPAAT